MYRPSSGVVKGGGPRAVLPGITRRGGAAFNECDLKLANIFNIIIINLFKWILLLKLIILFKQSMQDYVHSMYM